MSDENRCPRCGATNYFDRRLVCTVDDELHTGPACEHDGLPCPNIWHKGLSIPYEQMTDAQLAEVVRFRGVPSGAREVFPGRRIIRWLRDDDRDRARWDDG